MTETTVDYMVQINMADEGEPEQWEIAFRCRPNYDMSKLQYPPNDPNAPRFRKVKVTTITEVIE